MTLFILIVAASSALWLMLGIVPALVFSIAALLLLVFYHQRQLARLDSWLQNSPSALPDASGKWGDVFARLGRMVREQNKREQQIGTALDRLRRATSAMPEGVVILDQVDRIEWCNPVAEKHLGISAELDIGQHLTHLVRQTQLAEYLESSNYTQPLVTRQPRQQGLTLSLQIVPYGDRQKLLLSRDITDFERVQAMRRDFVANVSHELRTPLTVIGGFLETLSEDSASDAETRKWALGLMTDQARRMQSLVEDLLTLSRLENTENLIRDENVDVPAMLRSLYDEACSLSAGRHRITLHLNTDSKLLGSMYELRSAFSNLVSNAIRYTPEGGRIILNWAIRDGQCVFSVKDTGIGIGAEHISRLTERFYRVDRGRSRETGGTGLGLAIVKHVLSCHQAKLEVTSELGKGSCFSALLPSARVLSPKE